MNLSIIIPAFNEEGGIERNLYAIESFMSSYTADGQWELIVVNDGSRDGTKEILKRLNADSRSWP